MRKYIIFICSFLFLGSFLLASAANVQAQANTSGNNFKLAYTQSTYGTQDSPLGTYGSTGQDSYYNSQSSYSSDSTVQNSYSDTQSRSTSQGQTQESAELNNSIENENKISKCLADMPNYFVYAGNAREWAQAHHKLILNWVKENCSELQSEVKKSLEIDKSKDISEMDKSKDIPEVDKSKDIPPTFDDSAEIRYGLKPDCRTKLADPGTNFNGTDLFASCGFKAEVLFNRSAKKDLQSQGKFTTEKINKITNIEKEEEYTNLQTILTKEKNGKKYKLIASERKLDNGQKKVKFSLRVSNGSADKLERAYVQIFPEPSENITPASFSGNVLVRANNIAAFLVKEGEIESYGAKINLLGTKKPLGHTQINGVNVIKGQNNVNITDEKITSSLDSSQKTDTSTATKETGVSEEQPTKTDAGPIEEGETEQEGRLDIPPFSSEGECPLEPNQPYTHPDTNTVWEVTEQGTKRPFQSGRIFKTHYDSYDQVKETTKEKLEKCSEDQAGFVPFGPKYNPKGGALVKVPSNNKVYLLLDGKKYWINSEEVFNQLNYSWGWIQDVDPDLLNKFKTEGEIKETSHHPPGSLVTYPNSSKVYKIEKNAKGELVKRHIANEDVFTRLGYRFDRVVTIDKSETYPTGQPIGNTTFEDTTQQGGDTTSEDETQQAEDTSPKGETQQEESYKVKKIKEVDLSFKPSNPTPNEAVEFDADVKIEIEPENDSPKASDDTAEVDEDETITIDPTKKDPDSSQKDDSSLDYEWDFGTGNEKDNKKTDKSNVDFSFDESGNYTVEVEAIAPSPVKNKSATVEVNVSPQESNEFKSNKSEPDNDRQPEPKDKDESSKTNKVDFEPWLDDRIENKSEDLDDETKEVEFREDSASDTSSENDTVNANVEILNEVESSDSEDNNTTSPIKIKLGINKKIAKTPLISLKVPKDESVNNVLTELKKVRQKTAQARKLTASMAVLADQATNDAISDSQRSSLNSIFTELSRQAGNIANNTDFYGQKILDDPLNATIQTGIQSNVSKSIGINEIEISTKNRAKQARKATTKMFSNISDKQLGLEAKIIDVKAKISNNATQKQNLEEANSRIKDVDVASDMAEMTKNRILRQAGSSMLQQANRIPQTAAQLLGG